MIKFLVLVIVAALLLPGNHAVALSIPPEPAWMRHAPPWAREVLTQKNVAARFSIGRDAAHADLGFSYVKDFNHDNVTDYAALAYDTMKQCLGFIIVNQGERQVHFAAFDPKWGASFFLSMSKGFRVGVRRDAEHGDYLAVWIVQRQERIVGTLDGKEAFVTVQDIEPHTVYGLLWEGSGYRWSELQQ